MAPRKMKRRRSSSRPNQQDAAVSPDQSTSCATPKPLNGEDSRSFSRKRGSVQDEFSAYYAVGSEVHVYCKNMWYQGTILEASKCCHPHIEDELVPCYLIHYKGYRSKYDEWVMTDVLMAVTEENNAIAARDNKPLLEATEKKARRKKSRHGQEELEMKRETVQESSVCLFPATCSDAVFTSKESVVTKEKRRRNRKPTAKTVHKETSWLSQAHRQRAAVSVGVTELKPQPFFRTFSDFAVRGVSLMRHPTLRRVGAQWEVVVQFSLSSLARLVVTASKETLILIRFCRGDTTSSSPLSLPSPSPLPLPSSLPSPECHPEGLQLTLNGEHTFTELYPSDGGGKESFFPAIPITLEMLRKENTLRILCTEDVSHQDFLLFVERGELRHLDEVIDQLDHLPSVSLDDTITNLDSQLQRNGGMLVYSLMCPVAKRRLVDPVRGVDCQHVECFDGEAYIRWNAEQKPQMWRCPVCWKTVLPEDLIADTWVRLCLTFTKREGVLVMSRVPSSWEGPRDIVVRQLDEDSGRG